MNAMQSNRMSQVLRTPPVVLNLLAINILVFLAFEVLPLGVKN